MQDIAQSCFFDGIAPHAHFDQADDELRCPIIELPQFMKSAFDFSANRQRAGPGYAKDEQAVEQVTGAQISRRAHVQFFGLVLFVQALVFFAQTGTLDASFKIFLQGNATDSRWNIALHIAYNQLLVNEFEWSRITCTKYRQCSFFQFANASSCTMAQGSQGIGQTHGLLHMCSRSIQVFFAQQLGNPDQPTHPMLLRMLKQ